MKPGLRKRMGDLHEDFLHKLFGGRRARSSGNQFNDQMDGRLDRYEQTHAYAWDGKSTLAKSTTVSREMWAKAIEQSHGERPMLALRFYDDERLTVGLDLVVIDAHDMAELLEDVDGMD